MVKFTIPTQETNPLVQDGSIGQTMESLPGKRQPEAAYFGPIEGKRGGFIVINMEDESEVVTKLEPLWQELGATIETYPVATADDLRAGLQRLQEATWRAVRLEPLAPTRRASGYLSPLIDPLY